jgi:putative RecB family exonuclease
VRHEDPVLAPLLRPIDDHAVTGSDAVPIRRANEVATTGHLGTFFHTPFLVCRSVTTGVTALSYRREMTFTQALPQSLSPSRLSDFQTCPRRYQHASIERIPQPASYATAKGRFAHFVFEELFKLAPADRTIDNARTFIAPAVEAILSDDVRSDIGMDDEMLAKLVAETESILTTYFLMEDPTSVTSEGVELRLGATVNGTPLFGILDRLDRDADGTLSIVDYKTGGLPNRNYDSQTFANAELYAALCEAALGEKPTKIRLMYVAKGETIERSVTDVVVKARSNSATNAWGRINQYYDDGDFPATPSVNACRFCSYKELCRSNGVPVPR